MFWNLAIVRGVFGTVTTLGALHEKFLDEGLWYHITEGKTVYSYLLVTHNTGFFVFEILAQVYFDIRFKTFSKELHLHHLFSFTGLYSVVVDDINHYFSTTLIMLEMSTPFSCICFCLIKLQLADSLAWKINQMLLIHVFHLRSFVEFRGLYDTFNNWKFVSQMPYMQFFSQIGGLICLFFYLTPYWTYRKTEQLFTRKDFSVAEKKQR